MNELLFEPARRLRRTSTEDNDARRVLYMTFGRGTHLTLVRVLECARLTEKKTGIPENVRNTRCLHSLSLCARIFTISDYY